MVILFCEPDDVGEFEVLNSRGSHVAWYRDRADAEARAAKTRGWTMQQSESMYTPKGAAMALRISVAKFDEITRGDEPCRTFEVKKRGVAMPLVCRRWTRSRVEELANRLPPRGWRAPPSQKLPLQLPLYPPPDRLFAGNYSYSLRVAAKALGLGPLTFRDLADHLTFRHNGSDGYSEQVVCLIAQKMISEPDLLKQMRRNNRVAEVLNV